MTTRLSESGLDSARETVATAIFHGRIGSSCPTITTERGRDCAREHVGIADAKPSTTHTAANTAVTARRARRARAGRGHSLLDGDNMARTIVRLAPRPWP